MQYRIVIAPASDTLTSMVERLISDGWVPTGGVAACVKSTAPHNSPHNRSGAFMDETREYQYLQAMIKLSPEGRA